MSFKSVKLGVEYEVKHLLPILYDRRAEPLEHTLHGPGDPPTSLLVLQDVYKMYNFCLDAMDLGT